MTCKYCIKRGKTWNGADPRCAFPTEDSVFNTNNWMCGSLSLLRMLFEEMDIVIIDVTTGQRHGLFPLGAISDELMEIGPGYSALWMTWHNDRGATDQMFLLHEVDGSAEVSWEVINIIIEHLIKTRKWEDPHIKRLIKE